MTEHNLKILPEYFDAILNHFKRFEVREDDGCYQIGDYVSLRIKWDDGTVARIWMTEAEFCKFRYGEEEE